MMRVCLCATEHMKVCELGYILLVHKLVSERACALMKAGAGVFCICELGEECTPESEGEAASQLCDLDSCECL